MSHTNHPFDATVSAQLPMLVRGFYFEGWHPAGKPLKDRKQEEFKATLPHGLKLLWN